MKQQNTQNAESKNKQTKKKVWIYCANGAFFSGHLFAGGGTSVGELVFNTSLCGYQEIITDPSYAGQFITFCMPEIGIIGTNPKDCESRGVFCRGVIVRHYEDFVSNFRSNQSLKSFLDSANVLGICDIDTRAIVKMLRKDGAMMMVASSEISDKDELAKILGKSTPIECENLIKQVSTNTRYTHGYGVFDFAKMDYAKSKPSQKIIVIDFGVKRNILNELAEVGLEPEVWGYEFSAEEIISLFKKNEIGGVFLSNGPGDPKFLRPQIEEIKKLITAKIPIFGICLGHQLLSIAHGHDTHKLKFGHHGGNHPVKNLATQSIEITSQNHIYSVPESIAEVADITHRNLFDSSIEGVRYKDSPIFSLQHHPESSPGPKESRSIFADFATLIKENK